jgi:hypothetical protein
MCQKNVINIYFKIEVTVTNCRNYMDGMYDVIDTRELIDIFTYPVSIYIYEPFIHGLLFDLNI